MLKKVRLEEEPTHPNLLHEPKPLSADNNNKATQSPTPADSGRLSLLKIPKNPDDADVTETLAMGSVRDSTASDMSPTENKDDMNAPKPSNKTPQAEAGLPYPSEAAVHALSPSNSPSPSVTASMPRVCTPSLPSALTKQSNADGPTLPLSPSLPAGHGVELARRVAAPGAPALTLPARPASPTRTNASLPTRRHCSDSGGPSSPIHPSPSHTKAKTPITASAPATERGVVQGPRSPRSPALKAMGQGLP